MEDTGRIQRYLDRRARGILFGNAIDESSREELEFLVLIDRAHAVMLVERDVLSPEWGRLLLDALQSLEDRQLAPLSGRATPRGVYLAYEGYLIENLGAHAGGAVHLGRSRNDISATVFQLRLRSRYRTLLRELLRLIAVLVRRARRYARLTMPIYTHYQAALPVTFGHYLAGVSLALMRDLEGIERAVDLEYCPLGAGAAAGTSVPIDACRTAALLGFRKPVLHSIDAVASRDSVLRLLAASSVLGVTLSRMATDLLLWSTEEFGFIRFPDTLVGSSSMMPQKRNAFLLEHVQGRAGVPAGAFTSAVVSMHSTPFTNSIAVGTEGVKPTWAALEQLTDAIILLRLCAAGAEPRPERMRLRALNGFTAATELATRIVLDSGISFRQAHHRVGQTIAAAIEGTQTWDGPSSALGCELHPPDQFLDPATVAASAEHGGGPADSSQTRVLRELQRRWSGAALRLSSQTRYWRESERTLRDAADRVREKGAAATTASFGSSSPRTRTHPADE